MGIDEDDLAELRHLYTEAVAEVQAPPGRVPCTNFWGGTDCRNCGVPRLVHPAQLAWEKRGEPACEAFVFGLHGYCSTCHLGKLDHAEWAWEMGAGERRPVRLTPGERDQMRALAGLKPGQRGWNIGPAMLRMNRALVGKLLATLNEDGAALTVAGRKRWELAGAEPKPVRRRRR